MNFFWGGPKYRHFCCAATRPCTRVETSQPVSAALNEPLSPPTGAYGPKARARGRHRSTKIPVFGPKWCSCYRLVSKSCGMGSVCPPPRAALAQPPGVPFTTPPSRAQLRPPATNTGPGPPPARANAGPKGAATAGSRPMYTTQQMNCPMEELRSVMHVQDEIGLWH